MKNKIDKLELKLSHDKENKLLTRDNALMFIKELHKNSIPIYGFDGFNVGSRIKPIRGFIINDESVQPEQNYSRDYSMFTSDQSYQLCLEYFNKDTSDFTLYEISYKRS